MAPDRAEVVDDAGDQRERPLGLPTVGSTDALELPPGGSTDARELPAIGATDADVAPTAGDAPAQEPAVLDVIAAAIEPLGGAGDRGVPIVLALASLLVTAGTVGRELALRR